MADTDFDWTFDIIPGDEPIAPPPPRPEARSRPPPRVRPTGRRRWLLPAALLGLALIGAAALTVTYRVGWQRLRDQVAHEIAYEDAQSLARNVSAVDALHTWGTEAWRARRRAEAAAGLAAPMPADNLLPLPQPPQLTTLTVVEPGLYEATVVRRYADSAGQVYAFALKQHYRNIGRGLWARQPPPQPDPAETATWTGRRIAATYPLADQPWMGAALPGIDAYLTAACADWDCPDNLQLPVAFTGQVDELPRLSVVERPPGAEALPGGYPIIFDLAFRTPRYPRRVLLPSPQLAGHPVDEAASQALVRAITTHLLGQVAADLTVSNRSQDRVFLDALVARAEARLGFSSLPSPQFTLGAYVPVAELWRELPGNSGSYQPPLLSPRLQAAWFLEAAIGDRLASADARLLAQLRWAASLASWLEEGLQIDGQSAIVSWEAAVQRQLAAGAPPDWDRLAGLAYTCANGVWLARGGAPERLPLDPSAAQLVPHGLSADGRYLAIVVSGARLELQLMDLADLSTQVIAQRGLWPLGWSAHGHLLYLDGMLANGAESIAGGLGFYDPSTSRQHALSDWPIQPPTNAPQPWAEGQAALPLSFFGSGLFLGTPARIGVLTFDDLPQLQLPNVPGRWPALSPDGRWLAYAASPAAETGTSSQVRLEVLDLTSHAHTALLPSGGLGAGTIANLLWSPDGRWLAVLIADDAGQRALFLLDLPPGSLAAGGAPAAIPVNSADPYPLGFSADGRFLALSTRLATGTALMTFDSKTRSLQTLHNSASAVAWSPAGHLLAIAGPGGLFVTDPATGQNQWVTAGACTPQWYSLS